MSLLVFSGCALQRLERADGDVSSKVQAAPPVLGEFGGYGVVTDLGQWRARRGAVLRAFEEEIYGPVPRGIVAHVVSRRVIDGVFADGAARVEELTISLASGGEFPGEDAPEFTVVLVVPVWASAERPAPLIVAQNFRDNRSTLGIEDLRRPPPQATNEFRDSSGFQYWLLNWLLTPVFSRLFTFPLETMVARGFAVAAYSPHEIIPDSREFAADAIGRIGALAEAGSHPSGTIAVWAKSYSWIYDILVSDSRVDGDRVVYYGHSRHGKAALLAGATDDRVAAIIAHQSGTGGAALSRDLWGETIEQVTTSYPHWFTAGFSDFHGREGELSVDQHHLIALNAPHPVLVGNAWRDGWSGPNETFRALLGAHPVYRLYGVRGLVQTSLTDSDATGTLVYYIREGLHGHTRSDWGVFMDFLDRVLVSPSLHSR